MSQCNSTLPHPPSPTIRGGSTRIALDTLVLNLSLDTTFSKVFPLLKDKKARLQETDLEQSELLELKTSGGNRITFNLQRTGVKMFSYVLKCGDITLSLSERSPNSNLPNGRLQIGSLSSQGSVEDVYRKVKKWLGLFDIKILSNSVSRADICADMIGYSIQDREIRMYDEDYFIAKARSTSEFRENRKITGVSVGRGDLMLRIYDKMLEINKPHNTHKKDFFLDLWSSQNPDIEITEVTRVEYQLRRPVLKEFMDVGDLEEFLENLPKIWVYLTSSWFRHTEKVVDRKNRNQDKMKCSDFWKKVQSMSYEKITASRAKKITIHKSMKMLKAQLRGILITLCAGLGHDKKDYFGMLATMVKLSQDELSTAMKSPTIWYKLFEERQNTTRLEFDEPKFESSMLFNKRLANAKQMMFSY